MGTAPMFRETRGVMFASTRARFGQVESHCERRKAANIVGMVAHSENLALSKLKISEWRRKTGQITCLRELKRVPCWQLASG